MRRYLKKALGIIFIILGFIALITPCSPGSWLILVGLEFMGLGFLFENRLPAFLKSRHQSKLRDFFKKNKPKQPNEQMRTK
jgi:hypothetical protein